MSGCTFRILFRSCNLRLGCNLRDRCGYGDDSGGPQSVGDGGQDSTAPPQSNSKLWTLYVPICSCVELIAFRLQLAGLRGSCPRRRRIWRLLLQIHPYN